MTASNFETLGSTMHCLIELKADLAPYLKRTYSKTFLHLARKTNFFKTLLFVCFAILLYTTFIISIWQCWCFKRFRMVLITFSLLLFLISCSFCYRVCFLEINSLRLAITFLFKLCVRSFKWFLNLPLFIFQIRNNCFFKDFNNECWIIVDSFFFLRTGRLNLMVCNDYWCLHL